MAKYYYKKYSAVESYRYREGSWRILWSAGIDDLTDSTITGNSNYRFDSINNYFIVTGSKSISKTSPGTNYSAGGDEVRKLVISSTGAVEYAKYASESTKYLYSKVKGSFIEIIIAEDGTYPDDGAEGSYWYVKDKLYFPDFKIKIDGNLRSTSNGWVRINGLLRHIDSIKLKINGELKGV